MQVTKLVSGGLKRQKPVIRDSLIKLSTVVVACIYLSACVSNNANLTTSTAIKPDNKYRVAAPSPIDSLKELAPNKGLKTVPLFIEKLETVDERVDRLEAVVQKMKDDFDVMTPSVVRLVAIEKDIKNLVKQLESITETEDKKSTVTAPVVDGTDILPDSRIKNSSYETKKPVKLVNTEKAPHVTVSDIKIEENVNATRLVVNVSDKVQFKTKWNKKSQELELILYNADWKGKKQWESEFSPLISSYKVVDKGKDKVAKIDLNFPAKIINSDVIRTKDNTGYKLVLDIQSDSIHF